jgi:hypothetical protein
MISPGDIFPPLTMSLVGGDEIVLPDDFADGWAYVLFYRGYW